MRASVLHLLRADRHGRILLRCAAQALRLGVESQVHRAVGSLDGDCGLCRAIDLIMMVPSYPTLASRISVPHVILMVFYKACFSYHNSVESCKNDATPSIKAL